MNVTWARNADTHVADTAVRVRRGVATRRHECRHGHGSAIEVRITAIKSRT